MIRLMAIGVLSSWLNASVGSTTRSSASVASPNSVPVSLRHEKPVGLKLAHEWGDPFEHGLDSLVLAGQHLGQIPVGMIAALSDYCPPLEQRL